MPYCTKCGNQVVQSDAFCFECGSKIGHRFEAERADEFPTIREQKDTEATLTVRWIDERSHGDLPYRMKVYADGAEIGKISDRGKTVTVSVSTNKSINISTSISKLYSNVLTIPSGSTGEIFIEARQPKVKFMENDRIDLKMSIGGAMVTCPKCGSSSISGGKKGFDAGRAVVGGLAFGSLGLLAGASGASRVEVSCLNCGHKWRAT